MGFLAKLRKLFFKPELPDAADILVIGLGNPGSRYSKTRHNIGFRVVDRLAEALDKCRQQKGKMGDYWIGKLGVAQNVVAVKPLTFMNRSGEAVEHFCAKYKAPLSETIIVVDDFNLPFGTVRARRGGTHGGHNGLKSITEHMGSDFPRLRIGIGPLPGGTTVIDFVLGDFSSEEELKLQGVIEKAVSALKTFAADGIDVVMNRYNS